MTPFKKHLNHIISICAQEVMLSAPIVLGQDDIVITQTNADLPKSTNPLCQPYSPQEIAILKNLKITVKEAMLDLSISLNPLPNWQQVAHHILQPHYWTFHFDKPLMINQTDNITKILFILSSKWIIHTQDNIQQTVNFFSSPLSWSLIIKSIGRSKWSLAATDNKGMQIDLNQPLDIKEYLSEITKKIHSLRTQREKNFFQTIEDWLIKSKK